MDDFNSCFAEKLNEYVSFRHALGFSGIHHRCLKYFDEYCATFHPNECTITAPLVKGWIKYEINTGRGSIESKQSAIRAFAKFVGNDSYILTELYHVQKKDFKPYLLSEKELSALLYAADHLEKPKDPFFAETAGVIFRLMYTCGLRPTEARCLKRTHINFDTGEIFISMRDK